MAETDQLEFTLAPEAEFIELYKLLKLEGIAPSGAVAKLMVADGLFQVNGVIETRKRCKLRPGDRVEGEGITLVINA